MWETTVLSGIRGMSGIISFSSTQFFVNENVLKKYCHLIPYTEFYIHKE